MGCKQRDVSGPGDNFAAWLEGGEPKARPVGGNQAKASFCGVVGASAGLEARGGKAVEVQNGVAGDRAVLGVRKRAAIGKSDGLGLMSIGGCAGVRARSGAGGARGKGEAEGRIGV